LLFIVNRLHAAVVEFLQGSWDHHLNGGHGGKGWLVHTTKGCSEHTAQNFGALCVADIEERVILEEVVVEDLVTVLLVNVSAMAEAVHVLQSFPQDPLAVNVVNLFQMGVDENFICLADLVEFLEVDVHVVSIFQRMVF